MPPYLKNVILIKRSISSVTCEKSAVSLMLQLPLINNPNTQSIKYSHSSNFLHVFWFYLNIRYFTIVLIISGWISTINIAKHNLLTSLLYFYSGLCSSSFLLMIYCNICLVISPFCKECTSYFYFLLFMLIPICICREIFRSFSFEILLVSIFSRFFLSIYLQICTFFIFSWFNIHVLYIAIY